MNRIKQQVVQASREKLSSVGAQLVQRSPLFQGKIATNLTPQRLEKAKKTVSTAKRVSQAVKQMPPKNQIAKAVVAPLRQKAATVPSRAKAAIGGVLTNKREQLQTRQAEKPATPQSLFMKATPDLSITFTQLRIAPYEVVEILNAQITQDINEHGTLYVRALLTDEQGVRYATGSASGTNVILSADDHILFQGAVKDVSVQFKEGSYFLEVHGIAYSYMLDLKPNSRSFQDGGMPYETLIQEVISAYGGGIMDKASNGASIDNFILQYAETDWQFLKRMASHFNTGLVCDSRFNKPMIYFGIAHVQKIKLDNFNYTVTKDIERYKFLSENGVEGINENDFLRYEVETNQVMNIGDEVEFQGQTLFVLDVRGRVERGVFMNHVRLSPKRGLSQPYKEHHEAAGCSFNGMITDVRNDQVKMSLDIDGKPGERWFAYSTLYSSADGSGFYCMPELGDTARLYCPDGDDDHAYAISSVHEPVSAPPASAPSDSNVGAGIEPGGMRNNPDVKSFRSAMGKEIRLTPEGIFIISDGAVIILKNDEGIIIQTENDIEFYSEKNIIIAAEENVNIIGTEGVKLSAETASICLQEDVNIIGQEVLSNGGA